MSVDAAPFFGNGVSDGVPGRSFGPRATTPYADPQVPAMAWPPGQAAPSGLAFPIGGIPRGIQNGVEMQSNTFISHGYYARAWNNKAELKLVDGQFVFVHRDHAPMRVANQVFDVHSFINLPHMNMILRQSWDYFVTQRAAPPADADAVANNPSQRAAALLALHGEHEIQAYERAATQLSSIEAAMPGTKTPRRKTEAQIAATPFTNTGLSVVSPELKELCDIGNQHAKLGYVISPIYIARKWNIAGVVRAPAGAISGVQQLAESDRVVALTITVARRAEIADIFGGVEDGALCWFILRRILMQNGSYGPFQYVPYASAIYDYPPDDAVTYRDLAGNWARGLAFYVGRITLVPAASEGRKMLRANTDLATGKRFSTDLDQHRRATATLDICTIQLFD